MLSPHGFPSGDHTRSACVTDDFGSSFYCSTSAETWSQCSSSLCPLAGNTSTSLEKNKFRKTVLHPPAFVAQHVDISTNRQIKSYKRSVQEVKWQQ